MKKGLLHVIRKRRLRPPPPAPDKRSRNDNDSPLVDGDWLEARRGDPRLRIFDATTVPAFPEDGQDGYYTLSSGRNACVEEHITGAAFADLLPDLTDQQAKHAFTVLPSGEFAKRIGVPGVGEDSIVVVYDQFDPARNPDAFYQHWAGRLWWQLRLEGFDTVAVLDGGLAQWRREGRMVESGETHYPPTQFTARRHPELIADKEQVRAAISREDIVLMNTVDPVTHAGGRSTFSRPGHIPNSRNIWYEDIFDTATGKLKSPDELRAHFTRVGALDPAKRTITYCGSGIAASVEALAMLGRDDVAVYDGSLTE